MAGGEGTRLRPITLTRPKPLVPVAGEACIDFVLKSLLKAGIKDIIVTSGYRAGELMNYIGGGSSYGDLNIAYSIEDQPMGTAGGVKKMERFLDDTFIVASGDVLADVDFRELIRFHEERGAEATMALTSVEDPTQFGIVGIDDDGRIERFQEKPASHEVFSNLINAGIYILEPSVLQLIPGNEKFDFSKQLFPMMLEQGKKLFATPITGFWKDIGSPFDLIDANRGIISRKGGFISHTPRESFPGVTIREPFMAGSEVTIAPGCVMESCALFSMVTIGSNTTIRDAVVFKDSRIGDNCSIVHSIVGEGTVVADSCSLEDCVIGDKQVIPEGSRMKGVRLPEPEAG